jgi:hypothetical protein
MADLTAELLAQVTGQILEEAAFVFTDSGARPPPFVGPLLEVHLPFSGADAGELVVWTSSALARTFAANLLGTEADSPEAVGHEAEALGELTNIILGVLVGEIGQRIASMGTPRVQCVAGDGHLQRLQQAYCSASLVTEGDERLDAAIFLVPKEGP